MTVHIKNSMEQVSLSSVLGNCRSMAICGHIRPDGDCTGASLGLFQYMRDNFPDVKTDVYLETVWPPFRMLEGWEFVRSTVPGDAFYDLFLVLDCADADRIGFAKELIGRAGRTVCIDHHVTNNAFADENYIVASASSTSELVCSLLDPRCLTRRSAEPLYMGLVHDTGVFQYDSTTPETMRMAAMLLEKGVRGSLIIDKTYYEKTYLQNCLLGYALEHSRLTFDGRCIISSIPLSVMEKMGANSGDTEGIVSQLRITRGVEVAVFLYELEQDVYKVSLRSKLYADVSRVALQFGGGGHKKAAGCTCRGPVAEICDRLLTAVREELDAGCTTES